MVGVPRVPAALLMLLLGVAISACWFDSGAVSGCGDGGSGERCDRCPEDCGACAYCGDSACDLGTESCLSCPNDCGPCETCGDSVCDPSEDCALCTADCGACDPCGDGSCSAEEDCLLCPADCGPCNAVCGNDVCELGEDCASCASECACGEPGLHEEFLGTTDLAGTHVVFTPGGGGYYQTWACETDLPVVPGSSATPEVRVLTGDETTEIWLLFTLDYFSESYFQLYAGTNGTVAFGEGAWYPWDVFSVTGYYLFPRISPLFTDMADVELTLDHLGTQLGLTWDGTDTAGNALVFQLVLDADGTITFGYPGDLPVGGPSVVGIARGTGYVGTAVDLVPGTCP